VAPSTSNGKNIMPRVAALLDMMQVSGITKVVSPDIFERPIYIPPTLRQPSSLGSWFASVPEPIN
jgi:electron transfer flavoprotein alpha subunit